MNTPTFSQEKASTLHLSFQGFFSVNPHLPNQLTYLHLFFGVSFLETGCLFSRLWPQALQKAGVSFKASWSWWKFQPVSAEVAGLSCRCLLSLSSRNFLFYQKEVEKANQMFIEDELCVCICYIYIYNTYKIIQICSMDPNGQNPISIARLFEGINLRNIIDTHTHKMHHSTYT